MTTDLTPALAGIDLLALAEKDTKLKRVSTTNGGEWAGPCPFCGGRDRFRMWPGQGRFWCRQCEAQGDAISYIEKRDNLGFSDACKVLGGHQEAPTAPRVAKRSEKERSRPVLSETEAPSAAWQARGRQFAAYCQGQLWQDDKALGYLRDRGLCDDTIRDAGLGYNPKELRDSPDRWGLDGKPVWLPVGWVIPCESGGDLWYIKVRRPQDEPKYLTVKGGKLTVYGLDALVQAHYTDAIICEGEFDALLLRQHVGALCGVLALGSASKGLDMQAISELVAIRRVWLALDADQAGNKGTEKLLATSARMHPLPVPGGNDVTDAWRAGHDLVAWVVPSIGPKDRDRRLLRLKHWLDVLDEAAFGAGANERDPVLRVWLALLDGYNDLTRRQARCLSGGSGAS